MSAIVQECVKLTLGAHYKISDRTSTAARKSRIQKAYNVSFWLILNGLPSATTPREVYARLHEVFQA
ncbi:MAG: hypothetical protein ICV78_00065 [Tolypothrix sp. Co-bin9]|nr:hypothetical protein [Tolypothrix sp. Co-bin9]